MRGSFQSRPTRGTASYAGRASASGSTHSAAPANTTNTRCLLSNLCRGGKIREELLPLGRGCRHAPTASGLTRPARVPPVLLCREEIARAAGDVGGRRGGPERGIEESLRVPEVDG